MSTALRYYSCHGFATAVPRDARVDIKSLGCESTDELSEKDPRATDSPVGDVSWVARCGFCGVDTGVTDTN